MSTPLTSHWGNQLTTYTIKNESDTLCLILPGIAYYLERSYLDYSKNLVAELGYDVLCVEYGFQTARASFTPAEELAIVVKEAIQVIEANLLSTHKKLVIIGKSIGTCVQIELNKHFHALPITNVFISPIDKTMALGIPAPAFVITSDSDPLLSSENFEKLQEMDGITLENVSGSTHALDIPGDVAGTITALGKYIEAVRTYLTK